MIKSTSKFLRQHTQKVQAIVQKQRKFLVPDTPESRLQTIFLVAYSPVRPTFSLSALFSSAPVPKITEM